MKKSPITRFLTSFSAIVLTLLALGLSAAEKININEASVAELASALKGVGPAKAQAIVEYREVNGPFTETDQLMQVKGIGPTVFSANKNALIVAPSSGQ